MPSLGDLTVSFAADTSNLMSGIAGAKGSIGSFAQSALSAMGPLGIGLGILTGATIGVGAAATKMAGDYQQGMNMVKALTGSNTVQMAAYDSAVKSLAVNAGVAPTALTQGLYNVLSASYKGADAINVLTLATEDSKIGMTSAAVTTDALTNVLRSFGTKSQDITRVNGEMLETVTLGKSTFEQYASTIVKSASAATQFHVSMETMNAAWSTMTSSGIRAAQASTDFQSSLKVMYGNIGTVSASLAKNGIAFDEAKFNAASYGDKVLMLNAALEQANEKHVKITGVTLQAAQAVQTIAKHIGDYNSNLATLSDRQAMAQKTQQAWAITQDGFNQQMSRLSAAVDVLMIGIGSKLLPIFTQLVQTIIPVVTWFTSWVVQSDAITSAFRTLSDVTSAILLPPIRLLSDTSGTLHMVFSTLGAVVSDNVQPAFRILGGTVDETHMVFNTFTAIVSNNLQPALRVLDNSLTSAVVPAFNSLGSVVTSIQPPFTITTNQVTVLAQDFSGVLVAGTRQANTALTLLANAIGTTLIPQLKSLISWTETTSAAMGKLADSMAKVAGEQLKGFAGTISGLVLPSLGRLSLSLGNIASDLDALTPVALKMAAAFAQLGASSSAQGLGALLDFLLQLPANFDKAATAVQNFLGHLGAEWNAAVAPLHQFIDWYESKMGPVFQEFGARIMADMPKITAEFSQLATQLQQNVLPVLASLPGWWKAMQPTLDAVIPKIQKFGDTLIDNVFRTITVGMPMVEKFFELLATVGIPAFENLAPTIVRAMGALLDFVQFMNNNTNSVMGNLGTISTGFGILTDNFTRGLQIMTDHYNQWTTLFKQDPFNTLLQAVGTDIFTIGRHIGKLADDTQQKFTDLSNQLYTDGINMVANLMKGITQTAPALGSLLNDKIVSWFTNLEDEASHWGYTLIGNFLQGIANGFAGSTILSGIAGGIGSTLHIPGFASGVQNFAGGLALVGEKGPELVKLPQGSSVFPSAGSSSGGGVGTSGGGQPQVIQVILDSQIIGQAVGNTMVQNIRLVTGTRR